ncbi:TRAP transporter small permease [Marinobacter persicus]|jgi:TRAP-type C4-dicarboxylate transport system permease small subunit|uniref:TRAP transporter small permease protein n=1 Tax=Marinobacter persicus TaxID=930118 RepID=A0A2S6G9P6_9GAMM|nr:TRAP transporter small permease [Marinobacter persicus]PPK53215.1 TRAP-type C4-dicarboxylate transport system permease small subunit [Marinobacter persicus]PPK56052.1 TRAP-type C4-dicarboxylate transport system permease small subunit [Marinobacter persicus]PPK59647.1 TRAP-type C4-dicarboxylate transport system permease small subunit [Marinobacter persicus]
MSEKSPEIEDDTGHFESGLPGFLGTIDVWISKIEAVMLSAGVVLMAINTCVNVIARFVFGEGLFYTGEVNRILIILITFAGIGYAARHGRHIRMSALYDSFPTKARRVLMIFIALFTSMVMFFLCYYSFEYIQTLYQRGRILPALGFEIWWIYIWAPVGLAITGIQYLLTAIKNLTSEDVYLSTGVADGYADTEKEV